MKKVYLKDYKIDYSTRETATLVVEDLLRKKSTKLSLKDVNFTSRSFLDELYLQSKKHQFEILDIPKKLLPLHKVIIRSHAQNKIYAPELKINQTKVLGI